ncbi:MAG: hypothetical protein ACI8XO_004172 [Verrucomicrobiales bacterium]|jgi:hypothetical protein
MEEELGIQFEIFPSDALERYHLEGKLRVVGQQVLLHYKNRERTFTREQNKLVTIELALADIETLNLDKKWWGLRGATLTLKVKDPRKLEKMSGATLGEVVMSIPKKSIPDAEKFLSLMDYKISEDALERSRERLEDLGVK